MTERMTIAKTETTMHVHAFIAISSNLPTLNPIIFTKAHECYPSATAIMKPVVSAMNAWTCIVVSVFAIVILSVIGSLFKSNNHTMMGHTEDPEDHNAVAAAVFGAVAVYAGFLIFCASQAWLHIRESRRGAIALS